MISLRVSSTRYPPLCKSTIFLNLLITNRLDKILAICYTRNFSDAVKLSFDRVIGTRHFCTSQFEFVHDHSVVVNRTDITLRICPYSQCKFINKIGDVLLIDKFIDFSNCFTESCAYSAVMVKYHQFYN